MSTSWPIISAADFCLSVRDGTHDSPKPHDHGYPLVTSKNIVGGRLDLENTYLISEEDFIGINKRSKVDQWDVLISMIGTVGEPCLVKEIPRFAIKNIGLFKSRGETEGKWLYYYLQSSAARQLIKERSRGTTQSYVPLNVLRELPVAAPPLATQREITHILGTLDDKIELNRRMNETLEAMAKALFKSWFVDFDPVRAKAEGRKPAGMDEQTAALFPSEFVDSELGKIPKGWEVGTVDDSFNITMGQSPPGESYNEASQGTLFFQGRTDFGFRFPSNRLYTTAPTRFAEKDDTLVSVRAPVGSANLATQRCCLGRGLAAVRHKSGARSFTYYSMLALEDEFAKFEAEGTVFGSMNKQDFHKIAMVVPPAAMVATFGRLVEPMDAMIENIEAQSATLSAARDALLPRMISGEIT